MVQGRSEYFLVLVNSARKECGLNAASTSLCVKASCVCVWGCEWQLWACSTLRCGRPTCQEGQIEMCVFTCVRVCCLWFYSAGGCVCCCKGFSLHTVCTPACRCAQADPCVSAPVLLSLWDPIILHAWEWGHVVSSSKNRERVKTHLVCTCVCVSVFVLASCLPQSKPLSLFVVSSSLCQIMSVIVGLILPAD